MIKSRLIRYLLVGGIAYVIEMSALYSFRHFFQLSPLQAVAISFWVGFVVAFVLQKLVTFQNYEHRPHIIVSQLLIYSLLVFGNYSFSLIMVKLLLSSVSVYAIRTMTIVIVTSWNFVIYRHLFTNTIDH